MGRISKKKQNIKEILKKITIMNIITDLLMIIFGIFLFLNPVTSNEMLGKISGILLIMWGITMIFSYLKRDKAKLYSMNLIFGTLVLLMGAYLVINPKILIEIVMICVGVYLVINGASKIHYSLCLKSADEESWLIIMINGIVLVVLSIIFMFSNFVAYAVTQLIGIFFIFGSLINIMNTLLLKKRNEEIVKIFW